MRNVILSGMRPTGKLHIGHLSVLENWVNLQADYECYYAITDWHALTTAFEETAQLKDNVGNMILDWLAVGLDSEKSTIFIQSQVKEHAELHLLLSMITPLSWLERVPTYKSQVHQLSLQGKDISTYGFLGYPLLMTADILLYRANAVPVGEDQLPHLELSREVARRFNHLYQKEVFPEPQALLSKITLLPGTDGRKMSKSYHNEITIAASKEEIMAKVRQMITDPQRIRKTDPGNPDVCVVHTYQKLYNIDELENITSSCKAGTIGCMACKKQLAAKINEVLEPIREKRAYYATRPEEVKDILVSGQVKASKKARETMELVKEILDISYLGV
jgi:tryptophanyl-tRNA synthetase